MSRIPITVKRALNKLGKDLCDARKKRRIPLWLLAERATISRTTLSKIEKGNSGVSFGAYSKVIFSLGMIERLAELADPKFDDLGIYLESENLPKRIRIPKSDMRRN